jgi:hypothetical protein
MLIPPRFIQHRLEINFIFQKECQVISSTINIAPTSEKLIVQSYNKATITKIEASNVIFAFGTDHVQFEVTRRDSKQETSLTLTN